MFKRIMLMINDRNYKYVSRLIKGLSEQKAIRIMYQMHN